MSAIHGTARARSSRPATTPRRLDLVPRPLARTPRTPFVVLVMGMTVAGLVGLLVLNTAMQKNAFELAALQERSTTLATRQAALEAEVGTRSSPENLAAKAGDLGMVPNANPVFLRMSDGKVIGRAEPARAGTNLPGIRPPGPSPEQIAAREAAKKKAASAKATREAAEKKMAAAKQKASEAKKAEKTLVEKRAAERAAERKKAGSR